jgi:isopentenyldiphosphate isomerase
VDDEILDLVNKNDEVIGTINRKNYDQMVEENRGYIRASEMFIINDKGQLWIPTRTATKTIAPNGFDYSAAGHVESGDTYEDTMIRETKEELNLDITAGNLEFVTKNISDLTRYVHTIYLLRSNENPKYNPDDFTEAEWMTPDELIEKIDAGHPAKMSLRGNVLILQSYLQTNV